VTLRKSENQLRGDRTPAYVRRETGAAELQISARLLTREQAAHYCSLSPSALSRWISLGLIPKALPGTSRWDLKALDTALDLLSGITHAETSALDDWKNNRARRIKGNS
jgi:hypothetical protein